MLTVVDEVNRSARRCKINTHLGLTYLSFLEALCRLAASQGCPPGLPLSVLASDSAAAAAAAASPVSTRKKSSSKKKRGSSGTGERGVAPESGDEMAGGSVAARSVSPSPSSRGSRMRRARSSMHGGADTDLTDARGFYVSGDEPTAPNDLPSRLELLLCHIGVVENYNIVRCRRPPLALVTQPTGATSVVSGK